MNLYIHYKHKMKQENTFISNDDGVDDYIIFTRYLFIKQEVINSLFVSIIDKKYKEALFWGYELYFSGFQDEVMDFIFCLFNTSFSKYNSHKFNNFFDEQYNLWTNDKTNDYILGILIWNISIRPYDLYGFVEILFDVKCIKQSFIHKKPNIIITMLNIEPYKNIENTKLNSRFILNTVYKYKIHKEVNDLLKTNIINLNNIYNHNWLYYCYNTPLWKQRIIKFNGIPDFINKKIIFNNDDDLEDFYELYNYEPDEQPANIKEFCLGSIYDKQLSIKEFTHKYNVKLQCKKLK